MTPDVWQSTELWQGSGRRDHAAETIVSDRDTQAVLMFHGIGAPEHPMEPGEADYWIDWTLFDTIVQHCTKIAPRSDIFTFDDGNASDLEAARRMRAQGISGHFFILAGRIGAPGYMTARDVQELLSLGMEVGLHGRDHRDWRTVDDATLHSEVDLARQELAELCGREIKTVAIPYGAYNRRVHTYLQRSDFARIYTSDPGISAPGSRFIRRYSIMKRHTMSDIEGMLAGTAPLLARLRRTVMPVIKRSI